MEIRNINPVAREMYESPEVTEFSLDLESQILDDSNSTNDPIGDDGDI